MSAWFCEVYFKVYFGGTRSKLGLERNNCIGASVTHFRLCPFYFPRLLALTASPLCFILFRKLNDATDTRQHAGA
jgi:hypothetical protein